MAKKRRTGSPSKRASKKQIVERVERIAFAEGARRGYQSGVIAGRDMALRIFVDRHTGRVLREGIAIDCHP